MKKLLFLSLFIFSLQAIAADKREETDRLLGDTKGSRIGISLLPSDSGYNDEEGIRRRTKKNTDHIQQNPINKAEEPSFFDTREEDDSFENPGCWSRFARFSQNLCYQLLAATCWDSIMRGFTPGRIRAMELLDIQPTDHVLFVGEGSGLDFDVLPSTLNRETLWAFDFSSQMVRQAKQKARTLGIPEENCFEGDAQNLPFTTERFDKIYFPLSLDSIPNPKRALREAERVLSPNGKILAFDKFVDEDLEISHCRRFLNLFTSCTFADITRSLPQMMGGDSSLKIIHYESLEGRLTGYARLLGPHYRLAVLVRNSDYPDREAQGAKL